MVRRATGTLAVLVFSPKMILKMVSWVRKTKVMVASSLSRLCFRLAVVDVFRMQRKECLALRIRYQYRISPQLFWTHL